MLEPAKHLIDLSPQEMAAEVYPKVFGLPADKPGHEATLRHDSYDKVWREVKRNGRSRIVSLKSIVQGVVFGVEFISKVPKIIGENAFNDSGEISGFVHVCAHDKINYEKIFSRTMTVVFDPEGNLYHEAGDYSKQVKSCDVAFLNNDGKVIACWVRVS